MRRSRVTILVATIATIALPAIVDVQTPDGRTHAGRDGPAPGGDWGTSRYSTLGQITPDNVKTLGASWVIELPERETSRAFPIISDGLMFLTTNRGRILALDPATGKTAWSYSHPGYGGNRGVGAGEGLLFAGMGDSTVIAVDQKTGQLKWTAPRDPALPEPVRPRRGADPAPPLSPRPANPP